jgi:hypothetical protein
MLILKGKLRAIVDAPATTNRKTGELYAAQTMLQIETVGKLRGVSKLELHTITVSDASKFKDQVDKVVEVPVRAYAPGARVSLVQAD